MISSLTGILRSKNPTEILLDVHGVGFSVLIPLSTYAALSDPGSTVTVMTYLHIREDAMQLFGFLTESEREMFRFLLSVNGIGPKLAQNILSGIAASELRTFIRSGNASALTGIPGIGRKTAERIILDLKDKVGGGPENTTNIDVAGSTPMIVRGEALQAMLALGFPRASAERSIHSVVENSGEAALSVEELLKRALKLAGSR